MSYYRDEMIRRGSVFKRLETDAEFRERLSGHIGRSAYKDAWLASCVGKDLDDLAWVHWEKQRRIVEDVSAAR